MAQKKNENEYRIGGLWVAPTLRGRGYGSRLVQHVIDWAKADPSAAIQLWCHVGPQTAFYVKNGFHSLDRFRRHESDGRQIVEMQWSGDA